MTVAPRANLDDARRRGEPVERSATSQGAREALHVALGERSAKDVYARLRRVIVLGGAVRPTALSQGIHRSLLDLPLKIGADGEPWTLLDEWVRQTEVLAALPGMSPLGLMVLLDAASPLPEVRRGSERRLAAALTGSAESIAEDEPVSVEIKRDPLEYRGTGGVLHDIARELEDADYLVVATGAQVLLEPLKDLVGLLAGGGNGKNAEAQIGVSTCGTVGAAAGGGAPDVGILANRDGSPSGLMLIRCGALREISDLGFVDLKEQALPEIKKKFQVVVETRSAMSGASASVRTAADYLQALRHFSRAARGERVMDDPFAEDLRSEFSLVEPGALVDASARLYDSVVLAGATVGPGAVLVRSIACGGANVGAKQRGVEQLFAMG